MLKMITHEKPRASAISLALVVWLLALLCHYGDTACNRSPSLGKKNHWQRGDDAYLNADLHNPVTEKELKEERPCKGFTCPFQPQCGRAPLNSLTPKRNQSTGYITGGQYAEYGEWPSYVRLNLLRTKDELQPNTICGGVLISNQHVLTAARCTMPSKEFGMEYSYKRQPDEFEVVVGDHWRKKTDQFEQKFNVSSICHAKNYTGDRALYDFAILTLDKKVQFNDHVQPACLPYKPLDHNSYTMSADRCFLVGLGIAEHSGGHKFHKWASKLKKLHVAGSNCDNYLILPEDRSRSCFEPARNVEKGKGLQCLGDQGGPVLCLSRENRWTVAGLASFSPEPCDGKTPMEFFGLYTRIPALLEVMNDDCGI